MKSQMCPHVQYQLLYFDDNQLLCNQIQDPHHGGGDECLELSAWLETYREVNLYSIKLPSKSPRFPHRQKWIPALLRDAFLLRNSGVNAEITGAQC